MATYKVVAKKPVALFSFGNISVGWSRPSASDKLVCARRKTLRLQQQPLGPLEEERSQLLVHRPASRHLVSIFLKKNKKQIIVRLELILFIFSGTWNRMKILEEIRRCCWTEGDVH